MASNSFNQLKEIAKTETRFIDYVSNASNYILKIRDFIPKMKEIVPFKERKIPFLFIGKTLNRDRFSVFILLDIVGPYYIGRDIAKMSRKERIIYLRAYFYWFRQINVTDIFDIRIRRSNIEKRFGDKFIGSYIMRKSAYVPLNIEEMYTIALARRII